MVNNAGGQFPAPMMAISKRGFEAVVANNLTGGFLMMRELFLQGHAWRALEQVATSRLTRAGFAPDYAVIRRADDLAEPAEDQREGLVALIAARLGTTRLIDNLMFD